MAAATGLVYLTKQTREHRQNGGIHIGLVYQADWQLPKQSEEQGQNGGGHMTVVPGQNGGCRNILKNKDRTAAAT